MSLRKGPHVALYQGATLTLLPLASWEGLNHALDTGEEWWTGLELYGAKMRVRTSSITDIRRHTQASIDLCDNDDREEVLT